LKNKIDLQLIANELEFDLEDVQMLLEVFLESSKEEVAKLYEGLQNNDLKTIYGSAHAIKGSSANLLLNEISELAKEIELKARNEEEYDYQGGIDTLSQKIDDISID